MAGQREELYSLKGATVPYCYTWMATQLPASEASLIVLYVKAQGALTPGRATQSTEATQTAGGAAPPPLHSLYRASEPHSG